MSSALLKALLLLALTLATFMWASYEITELTGGETIPSAVVELTPESGEAIFWGSGRCYTCHAIGGRGSSVRGPNLGRFGDKFVRPIGIRAEARAAQRTQESGRNYSVTDYLIESLTKPDAYLVEGFSNEMKIVYAPPISMTLDEIKAIVLYMQVQGNRADLIALEEPGEITQEFYDRINAATAAGGGDPDSGRLVFEDNCIECHAIAGNGGEIGPDLTNVAQLGKAFISESITSPTSMIKKGYETWEVIRMDGRRITGLKSRDSESEIDILKNTGDTITIAASDIKDIRIDETTSLMPDDLIEALTIKDFQDVQAYLMMQKLDQ